MYRSKNPSTAARHGHAPLTSIAESSGEQRDCHRDASNALPAGRELTTLANELCGSSIMLRGMSFGNYSRPLRCRGPETAVESQL
jgi:hypothetical protein